MCFQNSKTTYNGKGWFDWRKSYTWNGIFPATKSSCFGFVSIQIRNRFKIKAFARCSVMFNESMLNDMMWLLYWLTYRFCYFFFVPIIREGVFKWLSKVITRSQSLRVVIGLKISPQCINQWHSRKPKRIETCTRDFLALWASYTESLQI